MQFDCPKLQTRWTALEARKDAGEIWGLTYFPEIKLSPANCHVQPQIRYRVQDQIIYEMRREDNPALLRVIMKLWQRWGPGTLLVLGERRGKLEVIRTIEPQEEGI